MVAFLSITHNLGAKRPVAPRLRWRTCSERSGKTLATLCIGYGWADDNAEDPAPPHSSSPSHLPVATLETAGKG